jgi:RNA polymerase sigma factor (sigma-70 family)
MNESAPDPRNDGELLAAFAQSRDETPFAALVRRHETMVYNACLRVLRESSDAEDAAQAVFLALATKAQDASLYDRASLAGWLYEAAWHVSVRARDAEKLRKLREREAGAMQERTADAAREWPELAAVLDGELYALPETYRLPIILFHLEQRSVEETAAALQCSGDAAKQRLSRGRDMLRDRLNRRGVLLSTGIVATLLAGNASAATAPATFATTTAHTAALYLSGQAIAAGQAALARAAADAVSDAHTFRRLRKLAAAVLLVTALAGCVAWLLSSPPPTSAVTPTVSGEPQSLIKNDEAPDPKGDKDAPDQAMMEERKLAEEPKPDADKPTDAAMDAAARAKAALGRAMLERDMAMKAVAEADAEARAAETDYLRLKGTLGKAALEPVKQKELFEALKAAEQTVVKAAEQKKAARATLDRAMIAVTAAQAEAAPPEPKKELAKPEEPDEEKKAEKPAAPLVPKPK